MYKDKSERKFIVNNKRLSVAFYSTVGDRENQQDSFDYYLEDTGGIFTICDGMGGHQGGETASSLASRNIVEIYREADENTPINEVLINAAKQTDKMVANLKNTDGTQMDAGSTMVVVTIRENTLHWLSVGDSRIYVKRGKDFVQVTFDHIYRAVLDEQLQTKEITQAQYQQEISKGNALISYIGMGGLDLIDFNDDDFVLQSGDIILLMSDGLYKIVSDEELNTLLENFIDLNDVVQVIEARAESNAKCKNVSRDNMTFTVIKMR